MCFRVGVFVSVNGVWIHVCVCGCECVYVSDVCDCVRLCMSMCECAYVYV